MGVTYVIVKVYVTECNKVINVVTIWQISAIEVTALLKILRSEIKVCKKKNLSWV